MTNLGNAAALLGEPSSRAAHSMRKRALDISLALIAIVVTAPFVLCASAAIRVWIGSPVIFAQRRAGYLGAPFTLLKLRTMSGESVVGREGLDDSARIGRLGSFIRRTSLDELPQLFNVLRGEMSLVGPRPLLLEYLPLYSNGQARRHAAKPGMTGLTQVEGRNALDWDQRFALDVWYVDNWSMSMDLRILLRTVSRVLTGAGVTAAAHATSPRFEGIRGNESRGQSE